MSDFPRSLTDDELTHLLARTAAGDSVAFRQLYDAIAPAALALATRVTGHRHLAEEILQEVFVHVWTHAGDFDAGRGRPRSWVLMLAHRRSVDCVRSVRAANDRDEADGLRAAADRGVDIADEVHLQVEADALRRRLSELSSEQQRVVALAYFGGYSQSEIAAMTGDPLGTVKSRMRGALDRLRTATRAVTAPIALPRATVAPLSGTEAVA